MTCLLPLLRTGLLLSGTLLASGCYTTTVRSGLPAAAGPSVEYDAKWHSGLILGIAELSGPYDLDAICPNGWAEITTETSFLNGLVDVATSGIYNPQSVTIVCSPGDAPERPAGDQPSEEAAPSGASEDASERS